MSRTHPSLIAVAAAMRAVGETWNTIAAKVGRSEGRVRRWPNLFFDDWSRHFRRAETHLLADVATEARQRLRVLLRSNEEKICLAAVQLILKVRAGDRLREFGAPAEQPPVDAELLAMVKTMNEMTDEEMHEEMAGNATFPAADNADGQ